MSYVMTNITSFIAMYKVLTIIIGICIYIFGYIGT